MIAINNLSYYIGGRAIYENASLHIKPNDKIGLIGLNGAGKSTLLRLINKELPPDEGEISMSKDCTLGFLNQDLLSFQSDDPILEVAMMAFQETLDLQHRIDAIIKEMEENYQDKLVEELTKLQERFEAADGYSLQSRAEEILEGIGFTTEDLKRPLREFSGGWRMRVMLAKLLLEKPSLLMLDEPTNHLDLPSIQWIEQYLRSYDGAVIIVSHDREFLNNTATTIVQVTQRGLNAYPGNYNAFIEEKTLREEIQQNAFKNQQQKIKQTERFIERFRAKSTKARQVQSKIKSLERMDMVEEVIDEDAKVNFKFNFQQKSGRHVATLEDVSKAYGPLEILKKSSINIERGDKIALIGANGKGKSTLLRIIEGNEPIGGTSQLGYNVHLSMYAQHQLEALTLDHEVLEELKFQGTGKSEQELRSVLGCFLFTDDDVFKKIKVLSGGEKSRVALAKTLISEANFLLLDEPTNHLDMLSVNILIQALQQYQGTFVVVSHDRHFVSQIANKIWWIEDHEIKEYPGTYEEFSWTQKAKVVTSAKKPEEKPKVIQKKKTNNQQQEFKQKQKELNVLRNQLSAVENQIDSAEQQKKTLEEKLSSPETFQDEELAKTVGTDFEKVQSQLDDLNERWEEIGLKIEEVEAELKSLD